MAPIKTTEEEGHNRIKDAFESKKPYSVPDGYFDTLGERIMAQIDTIESQEEFTRSRITLFTRLKPLLYLAASFLMLIGLFRAMDYTYLGRRQSKDVATEVTSQQEKTHKQRVIDQEYIRYIQSEYDDLDLASSGIWGY